MIGLVDEESALADILPEATAVTVNLLGWGQRALADAFAGVARRQAGLFHLLPGTTRLGPGAGGTPLGWIGARLRPDPDHAGACITQGGGRAC